LPLSWLYGCGAAIRNLAFSKGFKRSFKFDFPVIGIGNLCTGGTGKTPHTEFIISLLKDIYKIGVVSRGYGRITKGYFQVTELSTPQEVGDEPLQIKLNNPGVNVAVGERRILAIPHLLGDFPDTDVVLLDDIYRDRYVRPGLNILLTTCGNMFYDDYALPAGNLREFRAGYKRADIIIVTKSPVDIDAAEREKITRRIKPLPHQRVYFSWLNYGNPRGLIKGDELLPEDLKNTHVFFFAGIANIKPVEEYLAKNTASYKIVSFSDHYVYSPEDMEDIAERFSAWLGTGNKILLTTHKDAVKLHSAKINEVVKHLPLYVLPLTIGMSEGDREQFSTSLRTYIEKEKSLMMEE